jgi:RNA polymerase sigma-70 factor (ECF subfamily)
MTSTDTRVSVIVGVCRHESERWREFDTIYRPILLAFLRKRGLDESEASDVVQDIFVKLLGNIHTYDRTRCKFRTWLFSLAHNALIDRARRRAAYERALDGWAAHMLRATASESRKMEEEWVKLHRGRILEHALEEVRPRTSSKAWACFEQRLLRDRPAAAIAAELRIEPNAVYVHASRVLKKIREVCAEFDEDISHAFEPDVPGRR